MKLVPVAVAVTLKLLYPVNELVLRGKELVPVAVSNLVPEDDAVMNLVPVVRSMNLGVKQFRYKILKMYKILSKIK